MMLNHVHDWKCDPQGHRDGYGRSVYCDCGALSRRVDEDCVAECEFKPEITKKEEKGLARGTIVDFTNKYGFSDGEAVEDRDFLARDELVKLLNASTVLQEYRAVAYDRPGMHNACLILFFPAGPQSDEDLIREGILTAHNPLSLLEDPEELVTQAYDKLKLQT